MADRFAVAVADDLILDGESITVLASVGVAWSPDRQVDADLVALADGAMYESKRVGHGRAALAVRPGVGVPAG